MPTGDVSLYPGLDGYVSRLAESTWDDAHDVTAGDSASSTALYHSSALRSSFTSGGGRGAGFYISRCFFSFATTGIFNTPKSGTIKFKGYGSASADVIYCVKATSAIESGITTTDFDSIEGWDHDANNSSNVVEYADNLTSWIIGTNTFTLNSQALVDIAGQGRFNVCLLTYLDLADLGGGGIPPASTHHSGLYFSNHGTLNNRPVIKLVQQDDAVFFGANF
jgi:hypothetical protein